MLDKVTLGEYISNSIRTIVGPAIQQCLLNSFPVQTSAGEMMAEQFCTSFNELVADALGEALADAIDYYIKNMNIHGVIMTTGGPTNQTANINGSNVPMVNGVIPNTLGVS